MKPRISTLSSLARVPAYQRTISSPIISRLRPIVHLERAKPASFTQLRKLTTSHRFLRPDGEKFQGYDNSNARPAVELDHNVTQEEKDDFAKKLSEDKGKQIKTPWHREGSDTPPVARQRSAGAMTKGTHPHTAFKPVQSRVSRV
jgi:hypothetical protein